MYKQKSGFTLIEVLVVTVITAILGFTGTLSLNKFTQSGRDAARIQTLTEIYRTLQISDTTQSDQSLNFIYSDQDFRAALNRANILLSKRIYKNHCYFVGMAAGPTSSPKDNDFVIATWGESTSTLDEYQGGVLAVGTNQGVSNIIRAGGITEEYFHCDKPANYELLNSAFSGDYAS
jgi:prepilin-type N-terminal cleavage/methylation domain-containing protein